MNLARDKETLHNRKGSVLQGDSNPECAGTRREGFTVYETKTGRTGKRDRPSSVSVGDFSKFQKLMGNVDRNQ